MKKLKKCLIILGITLGVLTTTSTTLVNAEENVEITTTPEVTEVAEETTGITETTQNKRVQEALQEALGGLVEGAENAITEVSAIGSTLDEYVTEFQSLGTQLEDIAQNLNPNKETTTLETTNTDIVVTTVQGESEQTTVTTIIEETSAESVTTTNDVGQPIIVGGETQQTTNTVESKIIETTPQTADGSMGIAIGGSVLLVGGIAIYMNTRKKEEKIEQEKENNNYDEI